jgi:hypothetical protein
VDFVISRWCQQEVDHGLQTSHTAGRKNFEERLCFITGANMLFNEWLVRKPIV